MYPLKVNFQNRPAFHQRNAGQIFVCYNVFNMSVLDKKLTSDKFDYTVGKIIKAILLALSFCVDIVFIFLVFVAYNTAGKSGIFTGLAGAFCILLFPLFIVSVLYQISFFRKKSANKLVK